MRIQPSSARSRRAKIPNASRSFGERIKTRKITCEAANRYLEEVYIPKYNKGFTVEAKSKETAFLPTKIDLKRIFTTRFERKVRKGKYGVIN